MNVSHFEIFKKRLVVLRNFGIFQGETTISTSIGLNIAFSQKNDNRIFYIVSSQNQFAIENTGFTATRSLKTQKFKILLLF